MRKFVMTLLRFAVAFARGLRDPEFRAVFVMVWSLLVSGTVFYSWAEGWSTLDALYFSVTTLTTAGSGDLHPTGALSKVFTIVYLMVGIGVLVAFVHKLGLEVLAHHHRHHRGEGGTIQRVVASVRAKRPDPVRGMPVKKAERR